jgi:hypothetical protein
VVSNLTVTNNPADSQSTLVSWDASTDANIAGYQVFVGQRSGYYSRCINIYGVSNSLVVTGLVSGSTNFFAIREFDTAWNQNEISPEVQWLVPFPADSDPTNPVVITDPTPTNTSSSILTVPDPAPNVPVLQVVNGLTVTTNPDDVHSVTLSWDPGTDTNVAGFQVFGGQATGSYTMTQNVEMASSLVVNGLVAGTTNFFSVQAYDTGTNVSDLSPEAQYYVSLPVLNAVSGLTVTTNPADIHSILLSWNPSTDVGVSGYQVFSSKISGSYTLLRNVGSMTSLVVTGLVSGTTNFFTVREYDTTGRAGDLSPETPWYVQFAPVLHAITGLTVTTNASDIHSVLLKWNATTDAGAAGYQLLSGKATGRYTLTQNVGTVTSLVVTGLVSGTTNFFAVRDYDAVTNKGALSAEVRRLVPVPPVLHAITGLTIVTNAADLHSITLKWTATKDAGVAGYTVFIGQASGKYSLTKNIGLVSSLVITGMVTGTTNFFTLREYDGGSNPGAIAPEVRWFAPFPPPPNVPPTLNALGNLTLDINVGQFTVYLAGITSGSPTEHQTLIVAAISSNPALIPNPSVSYTSPNTTGAIVLRPARKAGTAVISVGVTDGAKNNNIVIRSFTVTLVDTALQAAMPKITTQIKGGRVLRNKPVVFGVTAAGQAPFKYQWKFNGTNLVGQTAATLTISAAQVSNAGSYMVQVSNTAGVTNSAVALLTVFTNTIPAVVTPAVQQPGQFSFQVPTEAGLKYVVEATTDFQNWTPVVTNTAPFTFTESNTASFTQRYYRSRYLP